MTDAANSLDSASAEPPARGAIYLLGDSEYSEITILEEDPFPLKQSTEIMSYLSFGTHDDKEDARVEHEICIEIDKKVSVPCQCILLAKRCAKYILSIRVPGLLLQSASAPNRQIWSAVNATAYQCQTMPG